MLCRVCSQEQRALVGVCMCLAAPACMCMSSMKGIDSAPHDWLADSMPNTILSVGVDNLSLLEFLPDGRKGRM